MEELVDYCHCHKLKVYEKFKRFIQWLKEDLFILDVSILEKYKRISRFKL